MLKKILKALLGHSHKRYSSSDYHRRLAINVIPAAIVMYIAIMVMDIIRKSIKVASYPASSAVND